jgi:hypothetical protein
MINLSMKVCKDRIRTPIEELEHLNLLLFSSGNFFSWEVHPNRVRASDLHCARLHKKIREVFDSEEYKDYNSC